ncbi:hypothetical protein [Candidatus Albibeggiatoa sp. nov. BB20]|uniref:hypothetical protein n=1 Tax=Candidatus Albibeggiatoa sp. nov. BB20 TaxID=3162723 RepID=UPI003365A303
MFKLKTLAVTMLLASSLQVQAAPLTSWATESTWNNAFLNDVLWNDKKKGHEEHRAKSKAACEGKQEGDSCEFEGRKHTVKGTCKKNRKDDLICRGEGKRKPKREKPE